MKRELKQVRPIMEAMGGAFVEAQASNFANWVFIRRRESFLQQRDDQLCHMFEILAVLVEGGGLSLVVRSVGYSWIR